MQTLVVNVILGIVLGLLGFLSTWTRLLIFVAAVAAFQRWISSAENCKVQTNLRGKYVVVTGANIGVGYVTAKALAGMGATVVMACRNEKKARKALHKIQRELEKAPGSSQNEAPKLVFVQLDLTDFDSVRTAAREIQTLCRDSIDILVNNAGVLDALRQFTKPLANGHEYHIGSNFLGPLLLTELLLPCVTRAKGRIVNVSSMIHWQVQRQYAPKLATKPVTTLVQQLDREGALQFGPFFPYSLSKATNIMYTKWLAKKVAGSGVRIVSLYPGSVPTGVWKAWYYKIFCPIFGPLLFFKTLNEGGQTSIHCCVASDIANGSYYCDCKRADDAINPLLLDEADTEALIAWGKSQVGLS